MAFKEAELRCPQGVYLPDDPEKYDRAFDAVLDVMDRFSPLVEDADLGLAFMDAAGLEPLYGSDTDLCGKVRGAISAAGQEASVGLAGSKFAAEVAARIVGEGEVNVIAVDDRKYLAGQGVDLLPLPEKALAQLRLLGIHTMSEFAALPRNSIRLRYGPEGLLAWRLAQGDDTRPLEGRERALALEDEVEFEWDEHNLDRITFALQALSQRLAARLEAKGRLAQRMRAEIGRSDGTSQSFTLDLPEPSAQARTFRDAVRWYLDANEAAGEPASGPDEMTFDAPGVSFIRIEVEELVAFEGKQVGMLANRAEQLERANRAMSRLRVELGGEVVYRTELCPEERLPERAFRRVDPYFEDPEAKGRQRLVRSPHPNPLPGGEGTRSGAPSEPEERHAAGSGGTLRLFDPPVEARFAEGRAGQPIRGPRPFLHPNPLPREEGIQGGVEMGENDGAETYPSLLGRRLEFGGLSREIVTCDGPHRLTSEWWEIPEDRDYFRVSLSDGTAVLFYRDPRADRWYVQGLVD